MEREVRGCHGLKVWLCEGWLQTTRNLKSAWSMVEGEGQGSSWAGCESLGCGWALASQGQAHLSEPIRTQVLECHPERDDLSGWVAAWTSPLPRQPDLVPNSFQTQQAPNRPPPPGFPPNLWCYLNLFNEIKNLHEAGVKCREKKIPLLLLLFLKWMIF